MGGPLGIGGGLITLILALIFGPGILSDAGETTTADSYGSVAPADSAREEPMVQSFTHGSARQRSEWFTRGYESGSSNARDTFGG